MKKFLLSLTLLTALLGLSSNSNAQCFVSNLSVNINSITPNENGVGCTINFDLSWTQEINNGNKWAYVHLWQASEYHTPVAAWPTTGSNIIYDKKPNEPRQAQLVNDLLTFVIQGNATATPTLGTVYGPDNTVSVTSTGTIIKSNINASSTRMEIRNITLSFDDCNVALNLKGDIWASQDDNGKNVHCVSQGLSVTINDPRISGLKICNVPRSYDVTISTFSEQAIDVTYRVYKDDGDGIFEPGGSDLLIDTKSNISVSSTSPYIKGNVTYPGSNENGENADLWLAVQRTGSDFTSNVLLENPCSVLPVTYTAFTASRASNSQVVLEWETAMEENNKGFHVQRNVNGEWKNIGFVFTQANNGNSSSNLKYTFKDNNSSKGISQYRILQVDMDGKGRYSEVRSIRGEEMAARLTVFPNPSNTGAFSILFEDGGSVRDVVVSDVSGRAIKQFKGVSNSSLTIDNLGAGFYTVQVLNRTTGAIATEKVIIKKR